MIPDAYLLSVRRFTGEMSKAATSHLGIDGVTVKTSLAQKTMMEGKKHLFFFLNTASTDCHSGVIKSGLDGCSVKLSRQTLCELDLPPTKPLSHREHDILNAVVALQDSQKMAEKSSSAVRYLDKSTHGESTTYVSSRRKDLYTHIQQMPLHISLKFVLCSRLSTSCILHLSASITFKFYPERKMSF